MRMVVVKHKKSEQVDLGACLQLLYLFIGNPLAKAGTAQNKS
jgi:hypothetical protein